MRRRRTRLPNPEFEPRSPGARCSACGRRGTWALISSGDAERLVQRFCWRCWPAAQERAHIERERSVAESFARFRAGELPDASSEASEACQELPLWMTWHWALRWGSTRRLRAHLQRLHVLMGKTGPIRWHNGRRDEKPPDLKRLGIRARALLLALDDALAQEVESPPLGSGNDLGPLSDELRADLAALSAAYDAEVAQARDWARRAEIAQSTGRRDLAITAEQRREQHEQIAVELAKEVEQLRVMLAEPT